MIQLLPIRAESYEASSLHGPDRTWTETNCYVDLWIEVLHTLGLDPIAGLAFTLSADYEGDQFQFFKYPLEDLRHLYGLAVAEMNPWRGAEVHTCEQLAAGRLLTIEVDAWHLPDTAGVSYQLEHTKTSIVPNVIDPAEHLLGYFHGAGYYELRGDDYAGIFVDPEQDPARMAPYVELVRLEGLVHRDGDDLTAAVLSLVRTHLLRRPLSNPIRRFAKRLDQDLDWLRDGDLDRFHAYAFVTLRQLGSCAELSASFCGWLHQAGELGRDPAACFSAIADGAKSFQFQLARVARGRPIDPTVALEDLARTWDQAFVELDERHGG